MNLQNLPIGSNLYKLSSNIKKTNYILFNSKQKQKKVNLNIKTDNVEIDKIS